VCGARASRDPARKAEEGSSQHKSEPIDTSAEHMSPEPDHEHRFAEYEHEYEYDRESANTAYFNTRRDSEQATAVP